MKVSSMQVVFLAICSFVLSCYVFSPFIELQKYSIESVLTKDSETTRIFTTANSTVFAEKLYELYPDLRYHIGVLSANKYLHSRATDVYKTYGKSAKSLSFYIGKTVHNYTGNLPLISLPDVDDSVYPPQKKSFTMMKHWCEHLLPDYDWFIKVDDDTYVKTFHLEQFLWSLDEKRKYYLGRPGVGLKHEIERLGLHGNKFCTGPTVIYSKPMLKEICPHIDQCMKEVVTLHEDTEVGRCLISKAGVQCETQRRKDQLVYAFMHSRNRKSGNIINQRFLKKSITIHEVKYAKDIYNLHYHYWKWLKQSPISKVKHKSKADKFVQKKASNYEEMCATSQCVTQYF